MSSIAASTVTSQRKRVLQLYAQILRLGRNWTSKDADRTLIERKEILTEAVEKFHANKTITDPDAISKLIIKAEARLVQAEHYGIPYERPEYLPPHTAYSELFFYYISMPPTKSTASSIESGRIDFQAIDLTNESQAFSSLCRYYLSGTRVPSELLARALVDETAADHFAQSVVSHQLLQTFPGKTSFRRTFLKQLTAYLEQNSFEVSDVVFEALAASMSEGDDFSYRVYLTSSGKSVRCVVRESNQQLCHGTTGLSVWQASCDLAHLMTSYFDLSDKRVLELGAGCGLTGLAVAASFPCSSVVLSDYDEKVLQRLETNVHENFGKSDRVTIAAIDWTSFQLSSLENVPDVILAADVVYDQSILPSLCSVLSRLLGVSDDVTAYVASTLRDPDTLKAFREQLEINGILIVSEVRYHHGEFMFDDAAVPSPSLFPHYSTLDTPTVIFQLLSSK